MELPQAGNGYLLLVSLATSLSPLQKPENKGKHHICSKTCWAQHFRNSCAVQEAEGSALNAVELYLHQNCHNYCFSCLHVML